MTRALTHARRRARGNYALLLVLVLLVLLGFGALALDVGWMLLARAQAQDVADAASQAGMIVLRRTGDEDRARSAAQAIVDANQVVGEPPALEDLVFGTWDITEEPPVFLPDTERPNAVHAVVGRGADQPIPYLLARIWGYEDFEVSAEATSATRSIQMAVVLDITGSWSEYEFNHARDAVLTAFDLLEATASGVDEVGMTIFTNRYAWAYTPFSRIAEPGVAFDVNDSWEQLTLASKGGTDADFTDGEACELKVLWERDDFTDPEGGCYPQMPREYTDERGTDHSTGIRLAQQLFVESGNEASYRAMLVLTDGRPNSLQADAGTIRAADGHQETRWREYVGPVPRSEDQIRTASIAATDQLWENLGVHTWVVSLIAHDPMMPAMVRGDGYYTLTVDSSRLADIVGQIVSEMPLAIVE